MTGHNPANWQKEVREVDATPLGQACLLLLKQAQAEDQGSPYILALMEWGVNEGLTDNWTPNARMKVKARLEWLTEQVVAGRTKWALDPLLNTPEGERVITAQELLSKGSPQAAAEYLLTELWSLAPS